jgi:outer membrane protein assembly factor BamD (BamD/ComL family)
MPSPTPVLKKLPLLLLLAALLSITACTKKKTAAELQQAKVDAYRKHQKIEAIKAYTDLVNKFPDSEHVAEAKERLKTLGPLPATPAPAKKQ